MAGLPLLPNLPSLQGAASSAASAAGSAVSAVTNADSFLSGKETQIVLIILGMLLIAAGIFSFDKTRELVVKAGKAAGTAAAVAA